MSKKLTTKQTADLLGVCQQRVIAMVRQGHFPHAARCECGMKTLIPLEDVKNECRRENRSKRGRR